MDITKIAQAQILQEPLRVKQEKEREEEKNRAHCHTSASTSAA